MGHQVGRRHLDAAKLAPRYKEKPMLNAQFLDDLSQKIREVAGSTPASDLNRNIRALLQSTFTKLELVTREEFDVQMEVLQRTRRKVEQLESRVAELEARLNQDKSAG
jgi:BMFP domain-containing protein YqiC